MAKKSLKSIVAMYKSAKIKPIKVSRFKARPFKLNTKFSSSMKLRAGK